MLAMLVDMNRQHTSELRRDADRRRFGGRAAGRRGRSGPGSGSDTDVGTLTIRRLDRAGTDRPALVRLAGRDSAPIPSGDLLGAEMAGVLIAAVSLRTGEGIADPFTESAAAREALEIRAAQITGNAVKQVSAPLTRRAHA